jgi:hypothetical protein
MSIRLVDVTTYREGSKSETAPAGEEKVPLESIPPMTQVSVGKYTLIIIEVHKLNPPWGPEYIVACRLKDGDYVSPLFHVYCRDANDFKVKVAEEIRRYEAAKAAGVRP